jgi:hypothetical protein
MLCDKYKKTLIESALTGATLPNPLRAHLNECAHCSETLASQQGLFAMVGEELRLRANGTVPANFDHRVRAALNAEPSSKRSRYLSVFTVASIAAAAAVLMAILFMQNLRRSGKETAVNSVVESKSLGSSLPPVPDGNARSLEPSSPRRLYLTDENVLKRLHALQAVAGQKNDVEILVPKGQEELLAKYMEGIAANRPRIVLSASLQHEPEMKPIEVRSVQISQMAVKPLPDLSAD